MQLWGGVPAKIIKYRFDEETIKRLHMSKWWKMSDKELEHYGPLFYDPDVFLDTFEKDRKE